MEVMVVVVVMVVFLLLSLRDQAARAREHFVSCGFVRIPW